MHLLRQSANVMVTLDNHARDAKTLYAVGVDGALSQPFGVGYLLRLGIEHLYEVAADDLALLLRVGNAFQIIEELVACVNADNVESESLIRVHNLLELVLAEHTVVNEDACKIRANGTVEQRGAHGRVNTAAESEDYAVVTELFLKFPYRRFNERGRAPFLLAAADINDKVLQEQLALLRMEHLGVELHSPKRLLRACVSGKLTSAVEAMAWQSAGIAVMVSP